MSNDYFEHNTKLVPGTKARAEDVNSRFDGVVSGLEKLPAPHATLKGFSDPVLVGDPTSPEHAVPVSKALGIRYQYQGIPADEQPNADKLKRTCRASRRDNGRFTKRYRASIQG